MKTFKASRLSKGNRMFPQKITVEDNGLRIKTTRLFSGDELFMPYKEITNMEITSPFIGFSGMLLTCNLAPYLVEVHGFKKSEIKEIRVAVESGGMNEPKPQKEEEPKAITHKRIRNLQSELECIMDLAIIDGVLNSDKIDTIYGSADSRKLSEDEDTIELLLNAKLHKLKTEGAKPVDFSNLYDEKIMRLINAAVDTGEITEKSKDTIVDKASNEDISSDEMELVLDGIAYQLKNLK